MIVRALQQQDWESVRAIYLQGIATGHATFQTKAPTWDEWDKSHLQTGRMAAVADGLIAGWCALSPVSSRPVYAGVAEVSVYIHENYRGRGIGAKLLDMLVHESENNGIWTLQAGIFPENTASLEIHKKAGFRILGRREKIGRMNGTWRDTILVERRSTVI